MKYTLIVGHEMNAPRKVGFHFWAEYLIEQGHDVVFISVGTSLFSKLRGKSLPDIRNRWIWQSPNLKSFSWVPPIHPCLNKPVIGKILMPFFRHYERFFPDSAMKEIEGTDILVVESGPGLTLIPKLRQFCPNAYFIYEVSDRLKTVGAHPAILEAEQNALPCFDFIRVPAEVMLGDLSAKCPVQYIPQGMDKSDFDEPHAPPYPSGKNAVSVGDMLFDEPVIRILAKAFPDWTFHLFGRNAKISEQFSNVICHGEQPIKLLTAYIQHADIGLAPYRAAPNCEYLSQSSLKMIQYTYCKLPIVAPAFAAQGRKNVLTYQSAQFPDQVVSAFEKAIAYDRTQISTSNVLTWPEVLEEMTKGYKKS